MAASNEWTEHHLTPNGWVRGNERRDSGQPVSRPIPQDRVLTVIYKETCNGYGPVHESQDIQWESSDTKRVEELLSKFGVPPKRL
jgi:hypothetical protein